MVANIVIFWSDKFSQFLEMLRLTIQKIMDWDYFWISFTNEVNPIDVA